VLEAATVPEAQAQAVTMSRRGGTVVVTSIATADSTVTLPQVIVAAQSRRILSAQNGNCRMRHDLPRFIRMMEDGWVLKPIITRRYRLAKSTTRSAPPRRSATSGVIVPRL
jgi:S-(hydroxymethyl)glutathione dehydrogenase/alcohol dehydrogenase